MLLVLLPVLSISKLPLTNMDKSMKTSVSSLPSVPF